MRRTGRIGRIEGRAPGRVRGLEQIFLGLGGAFAAVPGISALVAESWWPPEGEVFRVAPTVVGAGVLALMLLFREPIARVPLQSVVRGSAIAGVLGLGLMLAYSATLRRAVVEYPFGGVDERTVVPFAPASWISADLMEAVRRSEHPSGALAPDARPGDVTREHLRETFAAWGPAAIEPMVPGGWRNATVAILLGLYSLCIGMIVFAFGLVGIRLQAEGTRLGVFARAAELEEEE
ncbi:MAG TPA: hypothetical protein VFX98_10090 [Longimicrobiaceae bacterium]|nr:hypothetical protein [Longimicrobiaceae bacterium]